MGGRKAPLEGPPNEPIPVQQSPPEAERESQSNEAPQEKPSLRGQVNDLGRNEQENQMPHEQGIPPNMQENQMPREQVMEQNEQENQNPREQIIDQDAHQKEQENQVPREQGMDQDVRPKEEEIEQKPISNELNPPSIEVQQKDLENNEAKQEQPAGEVEKAPETSIDYSADSEQAS